MLKLRRFKAILVLTNKVKYYVKTLENYFICQMLRLSQIINND